VTAKACHAIPNVLKEMDSRLGEIDLPARFHFFAAVSVAYGTG
jgi:hypothetical protein